MSGRWAFRRPAPPDDPPPSSFAQVSQSAVTSFSKRNHCATEGDQALMADPNEEAEVTRGDRFIKTAVEILGETGRTDFTVQEIVARSKTSLRAFYQHFSSKDELLLALFDRTIAQSVQIWRDETTGLDSTSALKLVIDRVSQQPESSTQDSLNRALSLYNQHLAEPPPREYARVLSPLHQLVRDIVGRGITEGVFNPALDVGATAAIVMQTIVGAQRLHWLGSELNGKPIDAGPPDALR